VTKPQLAVSASFAGETPPRVVSCKGEVMWVKRMCVVFRLSEALDVLAICHGLLGSSCRPQFDVVGVAIRRLFAETCNDLTYRSGAPASSGRRWEVCDGGGRSRREGEEEQRYPLPNTGLGLNHATGRRGG
jgi:hypothetical protein